VYVVSAWAGDEQLVLGQAAADEKSNEITAVPKLLDIREGTVTIDAADYIHAVKDSQKNLREDIRECFEGLRTGDIRELPDDVWETGEERRNGRAKRREARTIRGIGWLEGTGNWKDL
jgi:hypothetical protein